MRPSKRYVLFESSSDLAELGPLTDYFERRYGSAKLIAVEGNPRALIVRTTVGAAEMLKAQRGGFDVPGSRLTPVLTSGAVGNLKRRAAEARGHGQVHE